MEEREGQQAVLMQANVCKQGSYKHDYETSKGTALTFAVRKGMKGIVEKLLAAGAKAETTDEVHGRRGWWAGDVW